MATSVENTFGAALQPHRAEHHHRWVNPRDAEHHYQLGVAHQRWGRLDEAVTCFRQAVRWRPAFVDAHRNLGNALLLLYKYDEATHWYRQTLCLDPHDAQSHHDLGFMLRQQGKVSEAISHYQHAVFAKPDSAMAHNSLGSALIELRRFDEGIDHCREAVRLSPNYADAHSNLGGGLALVGRLEEGLAHCRHALDLYPQHRGVYNNLGMALAAAGQYDEAAAHFHQALSLSPSNVQARWNLCQLWLRQGDFERGLPDYELRLTMPFATKRGWSQPRWCGAANPNLTVLIYTNNGLGDTIQFIRYASVVKQRVGKVVVECQPEVERLLAGAPGIDQLIPRGTPLPAFDARVSLLSLPGIFRTTLATIPATTPYLKADPYLVAHWRHELAAFQGIKIGIAWQGSAEGGQQRSIPLTQLAALANTRGVRLISLQKGPGAEQLSALAGRFPVLDLGQRLDAASGPFMDTAAIMMNLDLVISSDTSLAHLAGALGVPVWVGLPFVPEWRWLLNRADSPWYPTMRLFRQTQLGRWDDVCARMAEAVVRLNQE